MSLSKRSGSVLGRSGSVLHRSGSLLHHRRPSRLGSRLGAGMGRRVSIIRKNAMALFPNREETSSSEEDETDSELENGEKNVELTAKLVRDAKVKSYREELELLKDRHAALQGTVQAKSSTREAQKQTISHQKMQLIRLRHSVCQLRRHLEELDRCLKFNYITKPRILQEMPVCDEVLENTVDSSNLNQLIINLSLKFIETKF